MSERREMLALCARFDELLGPAGRRLVYVHMFGGERGLMLRFNDQGVPAWEDRVLRAGLPLFEKLISRVLDIRPGVEQRTRRSSGGSSTTPPELLSDGRPYLLGERFTAADLTFAALCRSGADAAGLRRRAATARAAPGDNRRARAARPRAPGRSARRCGCTPSTAAPPPGYSRRRPRGRRTP